jgi:hypothetical protein
MDGTGQPRSGMARLDGLLDVSYPPDPSVDGLVTGSLKRLREVCPAVLDIQFEPGSIKVMPDTGSFPFEAGSRPSQALLPVIRDLVEPLSSGEGCRVESTLRVQEFLGETVMEGVFYHEEDIGIVLKARERPMRPEERPTVPEPSIGVRAESLVRRYQWPLLSAAAIVFVIAYFGWQSGWFTFGGSGGGELEIDLGPLDEVVVFTKVKKLQGRLRFEVRPGPEFSRFPAEAAKCSLKPGCFRVLLSKEDEQAGMILPLDLSDLPEKVKDLEDEEAARFEVPYRGPAFDRVAICR